MEWQNNYNHNGDNRDALWGNHVVVWKDGRAVLAKAGMRWLYDKYNPGPGSMNLIKEFTYSFKLPHAPISMLANHLDDNKFWICQDTSVDGDHRNGKQVLFYGKLKKGDRPDYHIGHWEMDYWKGNKVLVKGERVEDIEFYRFIDEPNTRQPQQLPGSMFTSSSSTGMRTITVSSEWAVRATLELPKVDPLAYNVWRTGTFKSKVDRIEQI